MIQNIKASVPYVLPVLMLFLYVQQCSSNKKAQKEIHNDYKLKEFMYQANERTLQRDTTRKGLIITSQEQLILTKDAEKEMLIIENKRLKNVKSEVRVLTKSEIVSKFIPYEVVVHDTIKLKKIFRVQNEWYGVSGKVLDNGVLIDSMSFKNELVVTIGEKKNGLFKKKIPVVDIINKNPYSSTDQVYNVVVEKNPKKFYQKRGFQIGASLLVGSYFGIYLTK